MTRTPKDVWDEAPEGQAFITWWRGDDDGVDADGTVWIKGSVHTLDWDSLIWIAPIEIGERTYS